MAKKMVTARLEANLVERLDAAAVGLSTVGVVITRTDVIAVALVTWLNEREERARHAGRLP